MSTRYFYTDPLAAAWMAKHFGMRFVDDTFKSAIEVAETDQTETPFVIHPDSLHLLKPQEWDRISFPQGIMIFNALEDQEAKTLAGNESHWKIIQRNGIPFMWPASESELASPLEPRQPPSGD